MLSLTQWMQQKNYKTSKLVKLFALFGVDQDSLNFMLWFTLLYSPLLKIKLRPSSKSINRGDIKKEENKG